MPLYFFDIHDGLTVLDDTGRELADLEAARMEAMRIASGFAARPAMLGNDGGAIVVVVRDKHGDEVISARLVFEITTRITHGVEKAEPPVNG